MKTAKVAPSDLPSSRRAQPVRQTRINPPRSSGSLLRSLDSRGASGGGLGPGHLVDQRTEFFPAITHFADAITALPKELVRHFTLLKEVDAKIFAPEEALGQLVETALNCPLPERRQQFNTLEITGPTSISINSDTDLNGSNVHGPTDGITSALDLNNSYDSTIFAWDPENVPRRQLFRQCSYTMQEMLLSLDEKNHVISTATEALNKQMWRLKDVFPHIEREVSEEARYGSTTHWAYTEMRVNKNVERPRREIGNGSHNANSHLSVDEAAARSESRKQALLAKKSRTNQAESDFDDHDNKHKGESSRRSHGNNKKARPSDAGVGLGITNGSSINGNPPSKRRKVEKGASGGAGMERSLSSVFGGNGAISKTKTNSPRDTPGPEGSKKKSKTVIVTNGHTRKRTITMTGRISPSIASSPIPVSFAESKTAARASSPAPHNGRPTTSRGRQNSTQSLAESARQRPVSTTPSKQNGTTAALADLTTVAEVTGRSFSEVKSSTKDSESHAKGEDLLEEAAKNDKDARGGLLVDSKENNTLKREEYSVNGDNTPALQIINTVVTTKSGRASKPSTPAIPQFPEPARSRSARNALEQMVTNKRSHKKGAGQAAQLMAARAAAEDDTSSVQDDDDAAADEDEPTYCYCNGVSYGEMVACDSDTCTREWFHLECVGLKVAPKGNAKWYCEDCKKNMKGMRFSGR